MIEKKTAAEIEEVLLNEMDNKDAGHVYDYDVIPAGTFNGLAHNGVWVRVVKFDRNNYAYAQQSDSQDDDPALGSLSAAAEWIEQCLEMALDMQNGERSIAEDKQFDEMMADFS